MEELQSLTRSDVFILGAGFSRAVNRLFPLAADLLVPIRTQLGKQLGSEVQPRGGEQFEQWLSRLAEGQPYLSPDANLERSAAFLRVSKKISEILTYHENSALEDPEPEWLAKLIATWHIRQTTVISFNYDNLIEAAVQTQASRLGVTVDNILRQLPPLPPNLMHEEDPPSRITNIGKVGYVVNTPKVTPVSTFRLLKLHGSISWHWDDGDDSGATLQRWPYIGEFMQLTRDQTDGIVKQFPGRVPFIAPPSATKSKYLSNRVLRDFWREAFHALQNAANIYFLGYSVPPQDQAAMGLIVEGIGDRKPRIHIIDIHADTVRDNLAKLLVRYEPSQGEQEKGILAKKVTRLKRRYQLQLHSGDDSIKNFADSYIDELATQLANNLTDYARGLPAIDQVIEVDSTDPNFKINPVVGRILAMDGRNPKAMDFDGITIENGIMTIPCRIGNLPNDNVALTKLLRHLQTTDVRKIVLGSSKQTNGDAGEIVPIVDYRLKTNTQPVLLHPCWHSLHLTPFIVRAPETQPHYARMENID